MAFGGSSTAPRREAAGRPRLLQAGIEAFGQADVRAKILFTLGMLIVFRFVAHIPVPGVDGAQLQQTFDQNAVLGFLNIFSGGALENLSVAALGVYPYITATIVMQLATPLIPRLQSLAQEGEAGRQQVQRYTHYMTVPLAAFQGSVSAEHGIGLEKKPYIGISRSANELALMRTLKNALDSKGILNPGKVV